MFMRRENEQGYSLLEVIIILIVSGILLGGTVNLYFKFTLIHRRQQRVIQVERELSAIQFGLSQTLTTLPGRELGFYSGKTFSIPALPSNGTIQTPAGTQPLPIGLVTPYKVGGEDAISIISGRHDLPRLELIEVNTDNSVTNRGSALAAAPDLADASWDPGRFFTNGMLMMLIGSKPYDVRTANAPGPVVARLVRLTGRAKRGVMGGIPQHEGVQLDFDFCETGVCSSAFPNLMNNSATTSIREFGIGSALVPINIVNFYLVKGQGRSQVVRNDGGSFAAVPNSTDFQIVGGENSFLGEADRFKISYTRRDSATGNLITEATPAVYPVTWLSEIQSVIVEVNRKIAAPVGNEQIDRTFKLEFPITIKSLE
jgi:hypothetical protein